MCPTLRAPGDELPWEEGIFEDGTRYKYIHTVGTVGRVQWRDLGGHPYTGIFAGASSGFVRLSQANEPSPPAPGTAPGMGLKFLRDGRDSANLVAMYSVDGQDSWNFFKNNFTNHIAAGSLALLPVSIKFSEATNYIQQVGLSEWASHAEDGTAASTPTFPFMLRFRPSGEVPVLYCTVLYCTVQVPPQRRGPELPGRVCQRLAGGSDVCARWHHALPSVGPGQP